jgi:hypothetical protein
MHLQKAAREWLPFVFAEGADDNRTHAVQVLQSFLMAFLLHPPSPAIYIDFLQH